MLSSFLLITVFSLCVQARGTINDLIRLRDALFENYTRDFRPVYNLSDPVYVDIELSLLAILDLDEVSGTITMNLVMKQKWIDYRLAWKPGDFANITDFLFNSTFVWKPRVHIVTSADDLSDFGSNDYDVRIDNDGEMSTSPGKIVRATCNIDMTHFPTDSQTCTMSFLAWMTYPSEVQLKYTLPHIYMGYYTPNGEWDVDWSGLSNNSQYGPHVSMLDCTLHITRRSAYYIVSMVTPVLLLCVLNPFVFLLPACSGERISYIITMFLSLAVYMTLIDDNLPKVSDPMAGISYFLLLALCYSGFLVTLTILTLRCMAVRDVDKFPGWLVRIVHRIKYHRTCKKSLQRTDSEKSRCENEKDPADGLELLKSVVKELKYPVVKDDVMDFIDIFLFTVTLGVIVVIAFGINIYYWS